MQQEVVNNMNQHDPNDHSIPLLQTHLVVQGLIEFDWVIFAKAACIGNVIGCLFNDEPPNLNRLPTIVFTKKITYLKRRVSERTLYGYFGDGFSLT